MRFLLVMVFALTAISAFAGDYFDDFESYTVGDDLADYINWSKNVGGDFLIADDASDNIIDADFNGSDMITYVCIAPGVLSDVAVECAFEYSTYESYIVLTGRIDPDNETAYAAGLYFYNQYLTFYGIYYVDGDNLTSLAENYITSPVGPNTWTGFGIEITGDGPVNIEVFVNGSSVGSHNDSTYNLTAGLVGVTTFYDVSEPMIHVDDFNVVDMTITGVESASLGAIKAAFK